MTKVMSLICAMVVALLTLSSPAQADPTPLPGGVNPDNPETFSVLPATCTYGQTTACVHQNYGTSRPTVIVIGDSHAAQMIPAIQGHTANKQHNLVSFVTGLCPPFVPAATDTSACANRNRQFFSYLQNLVNANKRVTVVAGGYWHYYFTNLDPADPRFGRSKAFRDGELQFWNHLASRNTRTLAIGQTPVHQESQQGKPPFGNGTRDCQLREGTDPAINDLDYCPSSVMLLDRQAILDYIYDRAGRSTINKVARPDLVLCPNQPFVRDPNCTLRSGGAELFFDLLHLNVNYTNIHQAEFRWAVE